MKVRVGTGVGAAVVVVGRVEVVGVIEVVGAADVVGVMETVGVVEGVEVPGVEVGAGGRLLEAGGVTGLVVGVLAGVVT